MKHLEKFALGLGLFALTGCATVKIESNVKEGYTRKVSDLCVVAGVTRTIDGPFFAQLKGELEAALQAKGVRASVQLVDPTGRADTGGMIHVPGQAIPLGGGARLSGPTMPSPAQVKDKAGFTPAFLLTVEMSGIGRGPGIGRASFGLTLKEFDGPEVWKALLALEWGASSFGAPGFVYSPETPIGLPPKDVAARIMEKLAQDKLI